VVWVVLAPVRLDHTRLRMLAFALAALAWLSPSWVRATPPEREDESEGPDVTLERAHDHQAKARFADAAADYEQFAAAHPGDERAATALDNAYLLRVGLGQHEQAEADRDALERSYVHTQPERATAVFWSRRAHLDHDQARRDHAVAYLKKYRRSGGVDREIVAEAVIAQIDWRRSCHEPLLLDSCVIRRGRYNFYPSISLDAQLPSRKAFEATLARMRASRPARAPQPARAPLLPDRCQGLVDVWNSIGGRDRELAKAAQKRLAKLLARVDAVGQLPGDDPKRALEFAEARAMALVYRADAKVEALLLRTELPGDLEVFGTEETHRWLAKLDRFVTSVMNEADVIVTQYASVQATGSVYWTQAAALRTGELYESLADVIEFAETSDAVAETSDLVATREEFDAQCMVLANRAAPLRAREFAAYVDCFEHAAASQVESEFTQACVERLGTLDNTRYPLALELIGGTPTVSSSAISWVGVVGLEQ
jgi:hypothetical protein